MSPDGPQVLEFNVRLGDPEAQALLLRLEEDPVDLFLAGAGGDFGRSELAFRAGASSCLVLANRGYPGKAASGDPIEGIEDARAREGVVVFHAGTGAPERPGRRDGRARSQRLRGGRRPRPGLGAGLRRGRPHPLAVEGDALGHRPAGSRRGRRGRRGRARAMSLRRLQLRRPVDGGGGHVRRRPLRRGDEPDALPHRRRTARPRRRGHRVDEAGPRLRARREVADAGVQAVPEVERAVPGPAGRRRRPRRQGEAARRTRCAARRSAGNAPARCAWR